MSKTYEQMTFGEKSWLIENVAAAHLIANLWSDPMQPLDLQNVDLTKVLIKSADAFSLTDEQVDQVSQYVQEEMKWMVGKIILTTIDNSQPTMVEIVEDYILQNE